MTRFFTVAAVAACAFATPALAQEPSVDRPQIAAPTVGGGSTPTAAPKKETRYCVKDSATGSRIARRVCRTRAEWMSADGFDPTAK